MQELNAEQLDISLHHLTCTARSRKWVEFTGFPPVPPNRLSGYHDAPDNHAAGRDVFAALLRQLAEVYGEPAWAEAAALFDCSSQALAALTDVVVDLLLGEGGSLTTDAASVAEVADLKERAFGVIRDV